MAPRIAIVYYSIYGHIRKLAEAQLRGIEKAGGTADIFQIEETLSPELLKTIKAPPKANYPVADPGQLLDYDGFLFGIPTRYGNFPSQWRVFWDKTGPIWGTSGYWGKFAGLFVSSGSLGGGQESTALAAMSTLAHHGIIYVPLGNKDVGHLLGNLDEIHGGSAWGAGTFAGPNGSREPTQLELELAEAQGKHFYSLLARTFS